MRIHFYAVNSGAPQIAKARAGALLAARGACMPLMASPGAGGEGAQRRHKARSPGPRVGPARGALSRSAQGAGACTGAWL